ncbi:MAG: hypothetical protein O3C62_11230 [Actinomycetota bacterium]|nr:hypothetical protein [Actinomycetota bacterium]MDA2972456.1 hypothetical protein [Actinomycetota bacterium]MDA3002235.1 hypothetical protein [Actinomycetota bacterium]
MIRMRSIGLVAATLVITACGTTTYDETVATSTVVVTTTTLPEGTAVEFLPRLVTGLSGLSLLIGPVPAGFDQGDVDKRSRLAEIEALWAAVEREVVADDPDAADAIVRQLDLARLAVERSRPADADKAAKFVADVVSDYLADRNG